MALIDDGFALVRTASRSIGVIIPDVVVTELARDETAVTDHPVETGAPVSDHAFLLPEMLEMQCGWSNSTVGFVGYAEEVYQQMLALRAAREPFSVSTGKRRYTDMLIIGLVYQNNYRTEYSLFLTVRMRKIRLVNTQTMGAPASAQSNPASTQSTQSTGSKQMYIPGGSYPGRLPGSV